MPENAAGSGATISVSSTSTVLPYNWGDVAKALYLNVADDLLCIILEPSFLDAWTLYRDLLPFKRGTPISSKLHWKQLREAQVIALACEMMHPRWDKKYESPTLADRQAWTERDHFRCLMYKTMHIVAYRRDQPGTSPEQHLLEDGRNFARIRGVAMLILNLIAEYADPRTPSFLVRYIEKMVPAANPNLSPLYEVRQKWKLEQMDVEQLREKVLAEQRNGGKDEKAWLVEVLMELEGAKGGVGDGTTTDVEENNDNLAAAVDVKEKRRATKRK